MKILYALQGTGNGHISRAKDVVPALMNRAEVDVLVSGVQADIALPFPVKYKFRGLSFIFGKKGGISFWKTLKQMRLKHAIKQIIACPVQDYDLVINDFEPITAWACKMKGLKSMALSHQAAFRSQKVPVPKKKDVIGAFLLKHYAPCQEYYGFHFEQYDDKIYTPIIRNEIRALPLSNQGHYTVYLPAYSDEKLIKVLSKIKNINWQVFSKHSKRSYQLENIQISPIDGALFIESLSSASGVLCGAGFETPAEALFLKKKLLVVPMKMQYEQHLNAESLKRMGVPVLTKIDLNQLPKIQDWVDSEDRIEVQYPNRTQAIVDGVLEAYTKSSLGVSPASPAPLASYPKLLNKQNNSQALIANSIKS